MVNVLDFINTKMKENEIPYEYGEWTQDLRYPYFVGTFTETEHRFEDSFTAGELTVDGWSRTSQLILAEYADHIKDVFESMEAVVEDRTFFIRYDSTDIIPTGEEGLYRVSIRLNTSEWKGEA